MSMHKASTLWSSAVEKCAEAKVKRDSNIDKASKTQLAVVKKLHADTPQTWLKEAIKAEAAKILKPKAKPKAGIDYIGLATNRPNTQEEVANYVSADEGSKNSQPPGGVQGHSAKGNRPSKGKGKGKGSSKTVGADPKGKGKGKNTGKAKSKGKGSTTDKGKGKGRGKTQKGKGKGRGSK